MDASGRSPGGGRSVDHQRINSEVSGHEYGAHFQLAHIQTMHGDGKDAGIQNIHEVLGSRHGTGSRLI